MSSGALKNRMIVKTIGGKETKGYKQEAKNRLRVPMYEGGDS